MSNVCYMEIVPEGFEKKWAVFWLCNRLNAARELFVDDALDVEGRGITLKEMGVKYQNRDDVVFVQVWVSKEK